MPEWKYDIIMQTQLGERFGTMSAKTDGSQLNGTINLFKHSEPFCGVIDKDGNFEIKGKIITLMRTIEYVATGIIRPETVSLTMQGERNVLEINGVACTVEKELV